MVKEIDEGQTIKIREKMRKRSLKNAAMITVVVVVVAFFF